jgi:hypothetical protein
VYVASGTRFGDPRSAERCHVHLHGSFHLRGDGTAMTETAIRTATGSPTSRWRHRTLTRPASTSCPGNAPGSYDAEARRDCDVHDDKDEPELLPGISLASADYDGDRAAGSVCGRGHLPRRCVRVPRAVVRSDLPARRECAVGLEECHLCSGPRCPLMISTAMARWTWPWIEQTAEQRLRAARLCNRGRRRPDDRPDRGPLVGEGNR